MNPTANGTPSPGGKEVQLGDILLLTSLAERAFRESRECLVCSVEAEQRSLQPTILIPGSPQLTPDQLAKVSASNHALGMSHLADGIKYAIQLNELFNPAKAQHPRLVT